MATLRTALLAALAIVLVGCSKTIPYTSEVTVNRWHTSHDRLTTPEILIDSSLAPRTNDLGSKGGLLGPKSDQRIVIDYDGPLKLVPATPEDIAAMQAERQRSSGGGEP